MSAKRQEDEVNKNWCLFGWLAKQDDPHYPLLVKFALLDRVKVAFVLDSAATPLYRGSGENINIDLTAVLKGKIERVPSGVRLRIEWQILIPIVGRAIKQLSRRGYLRWGYLGAVQKSDDEGYPNLLLCVRFDVRNPQNKYASWFDDAYVVRMSAGPKVPPTPASPYEKQMSSAGRDWFKACQRAGEIISPPAPLMEFLRKPSPLFMSLVDRVMDEIGDIKIKDSIFHGTFSGDEPEYVN